MAKKTTPSLSQQTNNQVKVYTDGASSGNPGPSGCGCVIYNEAGKELAAKNKYIGRATNNIAEYSALLLGLELALELNPQHIAFFADSELMVKQIKKEYKVKNPDLKLYFDQFYKNIAKIPFTITHIKRELNKAADELAVLAKSNIKVDHKN
ncbi:MAG: ribonuclease HI family protein [bacterium]|nr:ribonuclease HI family protein [bacterium]